MHTLCVAGLCADYSVTCPDLVYGKTSTITGIVNDSNFYTCKYGGRSAVTKIFFLMYTTGGSPTDLCRVPFPACNSSAIIEENGHRCSCEKHEAPNLWYYKLEFFFDEALYKGKTLTMVSNCGVDNYTFTSTGCEDLNGEYIPRINCFKSVIKTMWKSALSSRFANLNV